MSERKVPAFSAPDADRKLSGRRDLRLDTAETIDDVGDRETTDRIEKVALHSPCERLLPGDRHRHPLSVLPGLSMLGARPGLPL